MVNNLQQLMDSKRDGMRPVTGKLLDEFEAIASQDEAILFMRHNDMLGVGFEGVRRPYTVDDFYTIRRTMRLAGLLKNYLDNDACSDAMDSLGIVIRDTERGYPGGTSSITQACLPLSFDKDAYGYFYWLNRRIPGLGFRINTLEGDSVEKMGLHHRIDRPEDGAVRTIPSNMNLYFITNTSISPDNSASRTAIESLLDALCTAHLEDVETVTSKGIPLQLSKNGISALWLAMCSRFAGSRIVVCEACGRPLLVRGERGQERKYCDDACRKWAKRNPDRLGQHTPTKDILR